MPTKFITAACASSRDVRRLLTAVAAAGGWLLVATAAAAAAAVPTPPVLGEVILHRVQPGENLLDLARSYGLGYVEIMAANRGIDPWAPPAGRQLVLPTAHIPPAEPRSGIVVNLGDMRLYWYRRPGKPPESFPIGIGRIGLDMPQGRTWVVRKRVNPSWGVPPSIRREHPELPAVVPAGPDNPLGAFSLDLARGDYRIHGTNKPDGVGRRVSHGCVHLYPENIAALFAEVPVGTPVTVVDQPAALAWVDGELYLQVHPSGRQADQLEDIGSFTAEAVPGLEQAVRKVAGTEADRVDWDAVARIARARRGVPEQITLLRYPQALAK